MEEDSEGAPRSGSGTHISIQGRFFSKLVIQLCVILALSGQEDCREFEASLVYIA